MKDNFTKLQVSKIITFVSEHNYFVKTNRAGNFEIAKSKNPNRAVIIGYSDYTGGYYLRARHYNAGCYHSDTFDFPYHYNRKTRKYTFNTFSEMMEYLEKLTKRSKFLY